MTSSDAEQRRRFPVAGTVFLVAVICWGAAYWSEPGIRGFAAKGLIACAVIGLVTLARRWRQGPEQGPGPGSFALPAGQYAVVLEDAGPRRIQAIKVLRDHTGYDLRVAKDHVDAAGSGEPVVRGVSEETALAVAESLRSAGATADVTRAPDDPGTPED